MLKLSLFNARIKAQGNLNSTVRGYMENRRKVTMDIRILVVRDPWLMQECPGIVGGGEWKPKE